MDFWLLREVERRASGGGLYAANLCSLGLHPMVLFALGKGTHTMGGNRLQGAVSRAECSRVQEHCCSCNVGEGGEGSHRAAHHQLFQKPLQPLQPLQKIQKIQKMPPMVSTQTRRAVGALQGDLQSACSPGSGRGGCLGFEFVFRRINVDSASTTGGGDPITSFEPLISEQASLGRMVDAVGGVWVGIGPGPGPGLGLGVFWSCSYLAHGDPKEII